jgi:hypothetical protein
MTIVVRYKRDSAIYSVFLNAQYNGLCLAVILTTVCNWERIDATILFRCGEIMA